MGGLIFYISSIIISLYSVWLFAFRTYSSKSKKRIVYPYIIYVIVIFFSFLPIFNLAFPIGSAIFVLIDGGREVTVDSWLFKKPGEK